MCENRSFSAQRKGRVTGRTTRKALLFDITYCGRVLVEKRTYSPSFVAIVIIDTAEFGMCAIDRLHSAVYLGLIIWFLPRGKIVT